MDTEVRQRGCFSVRGRVTAGEEVTPSRVVAAETVLEEESERGRVTDLEAVPSLQAGE